MLPDAARLSAFLNKFRASTPASANLGDRLRVFLDAASPLLRAPVATTEIIRSGLDPSSLRGTLDALRAPLAASLERGDSFNPWTASRLGWDEVRNSAVLAEFMRFERVGERAVRFLDHFFRLSEKRTGQKIELPLPDEAMLRRGYSVGREICPIGENADRIDLLIEGSDFIVGIEVKIYAPEGIRQLERYRQSLEARAGGRKAVSLIYLTRAGKVPDEGTYHATWRDVGNAARQCLPRQSRDWAFNDHLLNTFITHIQTF